jgi:hypothetical protein
MNFSFRGLFIFYPQMPIENHWWMLVGSFQPLGTNTKAIDLVFCISRIPGPIESLRRLRNDIFKDLNGLYLYIACVHVSCIPMKGNVH